MCTEAALRTGDMEAYRIYNRDLHAAITEAARNTYLSSAMGQLTLQSQLLMAKTIRLVGRPSRAIEEDDRKDYQVARTDVIDLADVGMVETGDGARVTLESLPAVGVGGELGQQHLDRDVATQRGS
jgi:hypothetical protein